MKMYTSRIAGEDVKPATQLVFAKLCTDKQNQITKYNLYTIMKHEWMNENLYKEQRERHRERDRDRENSNSKTLFYKDCSLGSFKNLSNN